MTGVFQGGGDTKPIMYLNILRLWIFRLPLAFLLSKPMKLGPLGLWIAMFISNLLTAGFGYLYLRREKWMHKLDVEDL